MNDFDDDGFDVFQGGDEAPKADAPLGLIVPPRAVVIRNPKGEVIFDGLSEAEAAYRRNGRPPVVFEEGDDIPGG
jgi:hypothetical protein